MDPERNQGGETSSSGNEVASVAPVAADPPHQDVVSPRDAASGATTGATTGAAGATAVTSAPQPKAKRRTRPKAGTHPNNVRRLRQGAMMSKAELARRAGVSPLTIDRVEAGCPCRMDTKRKILEALGLQPSAAKEVFPDLGLL